MLIAAAEVRKVLLLVGFRWGRPWWRGGRLSAVLVAADEVREVLLLVGVRWGRPAAAIALGGGGHGCGVERWRWRLQPLCRCRPIWGQRTEGRVFLVKVESPLLAAAALVTEAYGAL